MLGACTWCSESPAHDLFVASPLLCHCINENLVFVASSIISLYYIVSHSPFSAGSGVVRIDSLHFVAGCHTRRLNQALSVLSLILDFLSACYAVNYGRFCVVLVCVICVFCFLIVVRLSILVQVINWKDSSPK